MAQDTFVATAGPHWTGVTPDVSWWSSSGEEVVFYLLVMKSSAVDAPRGLEAMPMTQQLADTTTQSPFKIKVRRVRGQAKVPSAQPAPIVAEVDTFPLTCASDWLMLNGRNLDPGQVMQSQWVQVILQYLQIPRVRLARIRRKQH